MSDSRVIIGAVDTHKRTPQELFNQPQHCVIPLFQRAYVWRQEEQWEPLWKDVRRVAELRLNKPDRHVKHFLGAVVLQSSSAQSNSLPVWNVIDGQQRLTTLQVLMDATSALISGSGAARFGLQLEMLTHNHEMYVPEGESQLKLRHMNNDRAAYDEVMDADAPVDHAALENADSQLVRAHEYFTSVVSEWLGGADAEGFVERAEALSTVLQSDLQLVTIELTASEDPQEIFETLNARGTPLTAADLVRNFVFQRISEEGGDAEKVYRDDWPFETKFWSAEVSVGRYLASRSSVFLNQWLTARTGEDVRLQSTFPRFKSYVDHQPDLKVVDLLPEIKKQADAYEAWTHAASRKDGSLDPTAMAVYRMKAVGSEVLKPLLIWLHEPSRKLPASVIDEIIRTCESWVQRRQMLRLTNTDLGRVIADIIRANQSTDADELAAKVSSHLSALNVASTYWPGDDELRRALATEPVYRRFTRPRLRSLLEAVENEYRAETRQPQVERAGFPIEHILPQKWNDNWQVDGDREQMVRQEHVHRLGNLTLLTTKLNSKVSNSAWANKRGELLKHNTINMTGRLIQMTEQAEWDEALIDQRTETMIDMLLKVWPVPEGHEGKVADPQSKARNWVELKHLVEAGLLTPGDVVTSTYRGSTGVEATLTASGMVCDGRAFSTPSGAGSHVRKRATNGWYFWSLADGRKLNDVRTAFLAGLD